MWYLLLKDLKQTRQKAKLLEIGVYKGQVISLWSLIAKHLELTNEVVAISPLPGNQPNNPFLNNEWIRPIRCLLVRS